MNGQNAKTNFPAAVAKEKSNGGGNGVAASPPPPIPVDVLSAKLKKCCKEPAPSITCLRLDIDGGHIGVWQKKSGKDSSSNWLTKIELQKKKKKADNQEHQTLSSSSTDNNNNSWDNIVVSPSSSSSSSNNSSLGISSSDELGIAEMDDENRVAMQMVEELLNWNIPNSSIQN